MFARVDDLLADLSAFASGAIRVERAWHAPDDRIGAALIRVASGKSPLSARTRAAETPDAAMQHAAQRFIAKHFFAASADNYQLLGARRETPPEQLRKNYQRLIALVHPDSFPVGFPADAASRLNKAYTTLADPEAKERYDRSLAPQRRGTTDPRAIAADSGNSSRAPNRSVERSWLARLRVSLPRPQFRSGLIFLCTALLVGASYGIYLLLNTQSYPALVEARARPSLPEPETTFGLTRAAPMDSAVSPLPQPATPSTNRAPQQPHSETALHLSVDKEKTSLPDNTWRLDNKNKQSISHTNNTIAQNNKASTEFPSISIASEQLLSRPASATRVNDPVPASAAALRAAVDPTPPSTAAGAGIAPSTSPPSPDFARSTAVEDLLAQFSSAFESGSVASLRHAFSSSMQGKASVLAEYERVFQRTKQRSIQFSRMKHTAISDDRLVSAGHATVATVGLDDRPSRQRVYLEIEIAQDSSGPRIARIANYEQ